jgi:hypothetical protein
MVRFQNRPKAHQRHYHVVLHDAGWWVESEDGAHLHASQDRQEAVTWAVRAAQQDHAQGLEVIVCVEQADGSWKAVWHS